jgi:hypothetical protein
MGLDPIVRVLPAHRARRDHPVPVEREILYG